MKLGKDWYRNNGHNSTDAKCLRGYDTIGLFWSDWNTAKSENYEETFVSIAIDIGRSTEKYHDALRRYYDEIMIPTLSALSVKRRMISVSSVAFSDTVIPLSHGFVDIKDAEKFPLSMEMIGKYGNSGSCLHRTMIECLEHAAIAANQSILSGRNDMPKVKICIFTDGRNSLDPFDLEAVRRITDTIYDRKRVELLLFYVKTDEGLDVDAFQKLATDAGFSEIIRYEFMFSSEWNHYENMRNLRHTLGFFSVELKMPEPINEQTTGRHEMRHKCIVKGLNRAYAIDTTNVISDAGGEGTVYRIDAGRAMKIFHEPDKQTEKISDLEKLFRLNGKNPWPGLASIATVPEYLATDIDGKTIGYVMQNLQGWRDLNRLYTEDSGVSLKGVLNIFAKLHRALGACHDAGFVIGDLNGSNVLISALGDDAEVRIIDTDGWGMDRPDLGVSHGPYALDPEVIHPLRLRATEMNLPLPPFTPTEDWWTFTYLLTKCLTNRDPFEDGAYEFWDMGGDVLSAEDRRMMGRAAMHSGIDLGPAEEYARHLRMGIPLKHVIKRWLSCTLEGPFPLAIIEATMSEMAQCPGCGEQVHGRLVVCPFPGCDSLL